MSTGTMNESVMDAEISPSLSIDRAANATLAPFFPNNSAVALPMPEEAPVTITTLSSIFIPEHLQ
jgi:hypothetical protein